MAFQGFMLIVFIVSFSAFPSSKADLVDDVCSGSGDADFCKTSFRSDPRSSGADLTTLAQVGIDLERSQAISAASLVKSLGGKAPDRKAKMVYDTCQENYDDAVATVNSLDSLLKSRDYVGLNVRAAAVVTDADTCDQGFDELSVPEPDDVKHASSRVQTLGNAIDSIAVKLRR